MADNPLNVPPGGPSPSDYFERFLAELDAINKTLEATRVQLEPDRFAEKLKDVAEFYLEGLSKKASTPTGGRWAGLGDSGGSTLGSEPFRIRTAQLNPQETRAALGRYGPSDDAQASQGYEGRPPRKRGGESDGASKPPPHSSLSQEAFDRVNDISQAPAVPMLRLEGSHYTAQDFIEAAGQLAARRYSKQQAQATALLEQSGGQITPEFEEIQANADRWGRRANFFDRMYTAAPMVAMGHHALNRLGIPTAPGYFQSQGSMSGGSAEGGGISIPGTDIGFRLPFINAQAQAGMAREWNIQKLRMQVGINNQQAHEIFSNLNERGFNPTMDEGRYGADRRMGEFLGMGAQDQDERDQRGRNVSPTPSFREMVDAAAEMTKRHPELVNEKYYDLMDKTVRSGSASLAGFNANMERVAKVATETGYSMSQLQQDMDDVGNAAVQLGGTHYQGQLDAVDFQSITRGIVPSAKLAGLMQNPWVQTFAFGNTGLMPWQQGLANSGSTAMNVSSALEAMWNTVGPQQAIERNVPGTQIKQRYSSDQLKAATISKLMGGDLTPQEILNMHRNQNTIQSRSTLLAAGSAWMHNVEDATNNGRTDEAARLLTGRNSKDGYGALIKLMKDSGFSDEERQRVLDAGKGQNQHDAAVKRYNEIKEVLRKKDKAVSKDNNPKVTIELGPAAKKVFGIQNSGEAKRSGQAAQTSVNLPFGNALTRDPAFDSNPFG